MADCGSITAQVKALQARIQDGYRYRRRSLTSVLSRKQSS
jgi:hypothetical protein